MNRYISLFLIVFLGVISGFIYSSCKHDPTGLESFRKICFDQDIFPIVQSNCTMSGCHDGTVEKIDLRTYEGIMKNVIPGNPGQSSLYNSITDAMQIMPPSPYSLLSQEQRTLIFLWISQGAANSVCDTTIKNTFDFQK